MNEPEHPEPEHGNDQREWHGAVGGARWGWGMAVPKRAVGTALELRECWDTALSHRAGGWVVLRGAEVGLSDPCGSL